MTSRTQPFLAAFQRGINVLPYLRAIEAGTPPPPIEIPRDLTPAEALEAMRELSAMATEAAKNALPHAALPPLRRIDAGLRGNAVADIQMRYDDLPDDMRPTPDEVVDDVLAALGIRVGAAPTLTSPEIPPLLTGYLTLSMDAPSDPSPTSYAPVVLGLAADHEAARDLIRRDLDEDSDPEDGDPWRNYAWDECDETAVVLSRGPDCGIYVVIHLVAGTAAPYGPCADL